MISVAILTFNEEHDLPRCLESLRWCDDIHVIDSGSVDKTTSIAAAAGAHVQHHLFESFGKQRNWALANCAFHHRWILFLDADECSTPNFHRTLVTAVQSAPETIAGFYLCWKMMLDGVWLKRCDSFPKWQFRLLRQGRAGFQDFGHGQKEHAVQGDLAYIREPYLHFAFSKGWTGWLDRHNRYSQQEASERLTATIAWRDLISPHGSIRNKALKPLVSRIPGWPMAAFIFRYFLKLGLLEGRPGFVYCVNMAYYEFLIGIKMEQARRKWLRHQEAPAEPPFVVFARLRGLWLSQKMRRAFFTASLLCLLATAFYFALVPNVGRDLLSIFPAPIREWFGWNDDLNNFLLFAVLASVSFHLRSERSGSHALSRWKPAVALLLLVAGLEVIQIWIPGRFSSVRDVLTGSAGVVVALLVTRSRNTKY